MSDATADRNVKQTTNKVAGYPMKASEAIVKFVLVILNASKNALNGDDAASSVFAGVSKQNVDNSSGAAGDKDIDVWRWGVFPFDYGGTIALDDINKKVYIVDNQTVDLVGVTNNDIHCGNIVDVDVTANTCTVDIGKAEGA